MFILVHTTLAVQQQHKGPGLEKRSAEACHWITEVPDFQSWLTGGDPKSLVLLGKLGFGKTFTIPYLVQYLKSGKGPSASNTPTTGTPSITAASPSQQPRRNVYSHYCKDDGTTNKALNVFRNLLSQLLEDHSHLCLHFNSRMKEQADLGNPPGSAKCLKDLLINLVAMLEQPTFIIIDALDECHPRDRGVLLTFLEEIGDRRTTSTRVLTSARAASDLDRGEDLVPRGAVSICSWKLTPAQRGQRDRNLAEFLVTDYMPRLVSENVRQLLVDKLASEMEDCAIWARMTLEDLNTSPGLASPDHIRSHLEKNPLPTPLPELYLRIFENVTGGAAGKRECKWLLARSLELISGARDRLTFVELLYALSLYTLPSKGGIPRTAKTLAKLRENLRTEADKEQIRHFLRSFAVLKPTVEFVHQSLKEAVLEVPALTDAGLSGRQRWTGVSGIEGVVLKTCIDYLMLDDFNWTAGAKDVGGPALSGNSSTEPPPTSVFQHRPRWNLQLCRQILEISSR